MKNYLPILFVASSLAILNSCKEKTVGVNLEPPQVAVDTTYLETAQTAQKRNLLIEEFSGAHCSNCPSGLEMLEAANAQPEYKDRLVIISAHVFGTGLIGGPIPNRSKYDFRTQKGTDMVKLIFSSIPGLPAIGIDRMPYMGEMLPDRTKWSKAIEARASIPSPVNVEITEHNYDAQTNKATIRVKIHYTGEVQGPQFLSIVLLESNIVDAQDFVGYIDTAYNFRHVLRDYITPVAGVSYLDSLDTKEKGRSYERSFTVDWNGAWKPEHCEIVAFVHNNRADSKEVLQAAKAKIKD
jgi:hypothetical protein